MIMQSKSLTISAALISLLAISGPSPAYAALDGSVQTTVSAQSNDELIAKEALASTVTLYMCDSDGQEEARGTGFFIEPDILVTNFHMINGFASGVAKFANDDTPHPIVRVLATDPTNDLAILYVPGTGAPALKIANYQPQIGQTVYVAGSPLGLPGVFSTGIISSFQDGELEVTAPVSHGNSGSAVLDASGNVLGVINSGRPEGANIGFAIPASAVETLVAQIA